MDDGKISKYFTKGSGMYIANAVNLPHLFILATTQAPNCVTDRTSRGTLHYRRKTSLKAAGLYRLYESIEVERVKGT
jgi:hypothetical protein